MPPKTSRKERFPFSQDQNESIIPSSGGSNDSPWPHSQRVKKNNEDYRLMIVGAQLGDGILPTNGAIKISSWNINGIRAIAKRNQPNEYMQRSNPHIICFNEMKIDQDEFNNNQVGKLLPKEYFQYMSLCRIKKGYSGVAILSKTKPLRCFRGFGDPEIDDEGRTVVLEFDQIFLVSTYVPSVGTALERLQYRIEKWDPLFRSFLKETTMKKPVIWCGDANVAHREIDIYAPPEIDRFPGYTEEEKENFGKILEMGFVDTFRELYPYKTHYTFFKGRACEKANKGWRLDYFVVDKRLMRGVLDSKVVYNVEGSDHLPIEMLFDLRKVDLNEKNDTLKKSLMQYQSSPPRCLGPSHPHCDPRLTPPPQNHSMGWSQPLANQQGPYSGYFNQDGPSLFLNDQMDSGYLSPQSKQAQPYFNSRHPPSCANQPPSKLPSSFDYRVEETHSPLDSFLFPPPFPIEQGHGHFPSHKASLSSEESTRWSQRVSSEKEAPHFFRNNPSSSSLFFNPGKHQPKPTPIFK